MQQIIIIGAGCAGQQCAKALLKHQGHMQITLFDSNLTQPPLHNDARLQFQPRRIIGINRDKQCVYSDEGKAYAYDKIILATGAIADKPEIEGNQRSGIHCVRNVRDHELIKQQYPQARHIVILGTSPLALDLANRLHNAPTRYVTLIDPTPQLHPLFFEKQAAHCLKQHLEQKGVQFLLNTDIQSIMGFEQTTHLVLNNGSQIICDLLLGCLNTKPDTQLAEQAGLSFKAGVYVNHHLRTTAPNIYALGNCIQQKQFYYGTSEPIAAQAKLIAQHILSQKGNYKPQHTHIELPLSQHMLLSMGDKPHKAKALSFINPETKAYHYLHLKNNRVIALTSCDEPATIERYKSFVQQRKHIWDWQKAHFLQTGKLWYQ